MIINYYLFRVFIVRIACVIQTGEKSNSQHMFYHVKLFTYGLKDSNIYILVFDEKGIAWSKIQNLFMLMNMIGWSSSQPDDIKEIFDKFWQIRTETNATFSSYSCIFLGHGISKHGRRPQFRMKAIVDFPAPQNIITNKAHDLVF